MKNTAIFHLSKDCMYMTLYTRKNTFYYECTFFSFCNIDLKMINGSNEAC